MGILPTPGRWIAARPPSSPLTSRDIIGTRPPAHRDRRQRRRCIEVGLRACWRPTVITATWVVERHCPRSSRVSVPRSLWPSCQHRSLMHNRAHSSSTRYSPQHPTLFHRSLTNKHPVSVLLFSLQAFIETDSNYRRKFVGRFSSAKALFDISMNV